MNSLFSISPIIMKLFILLTALASAGLIKPKDGGECTKFGAFFGQCRAKCKEYKPRFGGRHRCVKDEESGLNKCFCTGFSPNGGYICPPGKKVDFYGNTLLWRCVKSK